MRGRISIAPGKAAILFVDLQEEHRRDPRYLVAGFDALLAKAKELQGVARANGVAVYHAAYVVDLATRQARPFHPVMADGSSAFSDKDDPHSAICAEVGPIKDETVLIKSEASAFGDGTLARDLRARGIEWIFIAGVWTEACIDATVKGAIEQGFRVILIKDACGSGSVAMHEIGILNIANRLYGGAVTTSKGACRIMGGETVDAWMIEGSVPFRFTYEDAATLYNEL
jgi:nicotinamidase-related amidase